jgi:hypothetical protein
MKDKRRGWLATDKQQLKAKMPAAGATQALRLFSSPLNKIAARQFFEMYFICFR